MWVAIAELFKKTTVKSQNNNEDNGYFLEKLQTEILCIMLFLKHFIDNIKRKRA